MKAITQKAYGYTDVLQVEDVPEPTPNEHEVLIKVKSVSINDWDWGLMIGSPIVIKMMYGFKKPKIKIPGVDFAGEITEVGSKVHRYKKGDRVYGDLSEDGFGAFAEYVCAQEKSISKIPESVSFENAAALPHASNLAIQGLIDMGAIKSGMKICINGAGGGVGTIGADIAKQWGVHLTGVDHGDKLEILKKHGFDEVIDYTQDDFTLRKNEYDLILDAKSNRPISHYVRALKKRGKYVTVGGQLNLIFKMALFGWVYKLFTRKSVRVLALKTNKDLHYVNELLSKGIIRPEIDGPYSFDKIPELVEYFGAAKHKGKIIVNL